MFAAVDLGSNSFRLHIGQHDGDTIRIVKSARDPIRLGGGLDGKGNLTEQAMQTALQSLEGFKATLNEYPLEAVRVVATNTMRIARNAKTFLPAAEKAIGYPIEIISGEEEGRLIYMGVASSIPGPGERRLVIDIGGGSTELILGKGHDIEQVESFSIGTVKHNLSFSPGGSIDAASFDAAILSARSYFEDAAHIYRPQYWTHAYGSSGTIRAIADAIAKNALGDGKMSWKSLEALKARLIQYGHSSKIDLIGMKPDRVGVMVGGLAVLMGLMQEIGIKSLTAVDAGLRMGVLWDLQLRATKRDRREQSVRNFLQRFRADTGRANRVAELADALYILVKPDTDVYRKHLYWSGLLHEIGLSVSHSSYHKHGAYLIEHADLPGFTTREQYAMSTLILGQKGNLKKLGEALLDPDFAKAVLALRLAVLFMHSRVDAPLDDLYLKMKNRIELEIRQGWLSQYPTLSYWIEKEKECWGQAGIDFNFKTR
jgi:exopolyphosphatase/guanosine-5'-triphosphate,3'-diphosphate pyrophosphatase